VAQVIVFDRFYPSKTVCFPTQFPAQESEIIVSNVSKNRVSVWPLVLTFVCLVALHGNFAFAQNQFRPSGSSAYNNGQGSQLKPGISKPPVNTTTPSFGRSQQSPFSSSSTPPAKTAQASSSQLGTTSRADGEFEFCTVEFLDEIDVPALETGQLNEMMVREGDTVKAGVPFAKIDDTLLKLQLMQALVRKQNAYRIANDRTSIEAADAQIQLNRHTYDTTKRLERKGARSADERMRARYEYDVAVLQREAATSRQLEAQGEAELESARETEVKERISRHDVIARFDGVVIDRYKQAGEWVTAGEPVARIARMDKLYVTVLISNNEYNTDEVRGKDVVVTVKLARNEKMEFRGKIVFIGAKDLAGSGNEFKVKAEITNKQRNGQWVLRKETRVSMRINMN